MILILLAFAALLYLFPVFRIFCLNPLSSVYYGISDFVVFMLHKDWRICKTADLVCYSGLFGKGKTLSAVHDVLSFYKRFNNKRVFCPERKKWVTQKVRVLSNVHIANVDFEYMKSLSQIVRFANTQHDIDIANDELTLLVTLIDEASVNLNNRGFKDNISSEFLGSLLCSRHYHIAKIFTTSQRFHLEDKLLRDVTQKVVDCDKVWRYQVQRVYSAWELENVSNPLQLRPLYISGFFVRNRDYQAYNTYSVVEDLEKKSKEMMSDSEILALRNPCDNSPDNILRPSRKFKRSRRNK